MGVDVFAPIMMQPQLSPPGRLDARGVFMMMTLGHLKPGVTVAEAARADRGDRGAARRRTSRSPTSRGAQTVVPIWQSPFGAQTYMLPAVAVLGGMGMLILLVVCANVANLVLVRGVSRRGELAVRLALGASRGRLLRLLFVENLVLAIPGAIAGVALASVVLPFIAAGAAGAAPTRVYLDTSVDWYVLVFAIVLSCGCALVFGFVPALRTSRVELDIADERHLAAHGGARTAALDAGRVASGGLAGAADRRRSGAAQLRGRAAGRRRIRRDRTSPSVAVDLQTAGYDEPRGRVVDHSPCSTRVAAEPAFEGASLAMNVPMSLVDGASRAVTIEGYAPRADEDMMFLYNIVSPDYFQTLRIPLLAGREFTRTDDATRSRR